MHRTDPRGIRDGCSHPLLRSPPDFVGNLCIAHRFWDPPLTEVYRKDRDTHHTAETIRNQLRHATNRQYEQEKASRCAPRRLHRALCPVYDGQQQQRRSRQDAARFLLSALRGSGLQPGARSYSAPPHTQRGPAPPAQPAPRRLPPAPRSPLTAAAGPPELRGDGGPPATGAAALAHLRRRPG